MVPLTRIVPVAPAALPAAENVDAVIVTSANAAPYIPDGLTGKPLFAVGDTTAAAMREIGFGDVRAAAGTAVDLARLIGATMKPGSRLLHLAAVERTAGFEEELHRIGFAVEVREIYSAEEISQPPGFLAASLREAIWGAPVLSARAAALLADIVASAACGRAFEKTVCFCISDKVADGLRPLAPSRVRVSEQPSEDSVLALLSSQP